MQKTRVLFDVMRFRKYLADNYKSQDEFVTETGNVKETLPIITIYFLNFKLPSIEFPLLKISRSYMDLVTKEVLFVKDDFIEQLTHDCYAIQIPRLRLNMQNRVEKLLSIFNQKYVKTADNKILNLPPEWNDDAELKEFIERLNKPLQDENMIRRADAEDEIESKFEDIERKLEEAKKGKVQAEQAKAQLEKQIEAAIEKMLLSKLFTIEQIAEFQNLPIENIIKVKLKLNL